MIDGNRIYSETAGARECFLEFTRFTGVVESEQTTSGMVHIYLRHQDGCKREGHEFKGSGGL